MNLSDDIRCLVEIQTACSLPICNKSNEIVYCYSVQNVDDNAFRVSKIKHIYKREHGTSKIEEIDPLDCFSENQLNEITEAINRFAFDDDKLNQMYDEYMERYDFFYSYKYSHQMTPEQKDNNTKMFELLENMLANTVFITIFEHMGKDMLGFMKGEN
ncbi:hypothetical protein [Fusibacter bizertensis]